MQEFETARTSPTLPKEKRISVRVLNLVKKIRIAFVANAADYFSSEARFRSASLLDLEDARLEWLADKESPLLTEEITELVRKSIDRLRTAADTIEKAKIMNDLLGTVVKLSGRGLGTENNTFSLVVLQRTLSENPDYKREIEDILASLDNEYRHYSAILQAGSGIVDFKRPLEAADYYEELSQAPFVNRENSQQRIVEWTELIIALVIQSVTRYQEAMTQNDSFFSDIFQKSIGADLQRVKGSCRASIFRTIRRNDESRARDFFTTVSELERSLRDKRDGQLLIEDWLTIFQYYKKTTDELR